MMILVCDYIVYFTFQHFYVRLSANEHTDGSLSKVNEKKYRNSSVKTGKYLQRGLRDKKKKVEYGKQRLVVGKQKKKEKKINWLSTIEREIDIVYNAQRLLAVDASFFLSHFLHRSD